MTTHHDSKSRFDRTAALLRALADPTRLEILRLLTAGPSLPVREISERLSLPQATTSYHLKLLRQAGVLSSRSQGAAELHELTATGADLLRRSLLDVLGLNTGQTDPSTRVTSEGALPERVAVRLLDEFRGTFGEGVIERYVRESLLAFAQTDDDLLPALVHRFARERLRALAQAQGKVSKDSPELLFVCVRNAGRSQMAAGLATRLSGGRVSARSAGSRPVVGVDPIVAQAMWERGVDLIEQFPKPLTDEVVRAADVVITMGCGDACPIYPAKRYEDWEIEDPVGQPLERVRLIRDEIMHRVMGLLRDLGVRLVA
ncbi:MAG: metalloregulator ArsR/SmtB family transcription factor [Chloroflexi bacterium]|nr:metalloregulator ArsR/SmtB family transcription factor [Chloroflexota bacterium]